MDLGTVLRQSAARNAHKTALVPDALARWLLSQGLAGSDRVAIHWMNSVEVVKASDF